MFRTLPFVGSDVVMVGFLVSRGLIPVELAHHYCPGLQEGFLRRFHWCC